MIALALTALICIGDSNVAGWGLRPSEPSFAQVLDCETSGHPGFGVLRDPAGKAKGQLVARAAVLEASFRRADVVVLSFLTNDVVSAAPVEQIARTLGRRYREAQRSADRVLVVPPLVWVDGSGDVAVSLRRRQITLAEILPDYVDARDIVDVSEIGAAEHADEVHLNARGHAVLAGAIVGALEVRP
ncbi:MAG: hypothetical protein C4558_06305 [Dehalococcoidia bacterium]|nr:MAG: hypothetical protein C4558_06305 [Dehalococcoidia bacterium]